jgi:hypothetical protein
MDKGDARVTLPLVSIKGSMGGPGGLSMQRGPWGLLRSLQESSTLKKELLAGVFYFVLYGGKTSTLYTTSIQWDTINTGKIARKVTLGAL